MIFWILRGVKGQKTVESDKKFSVKLHILGTIHHVVVIHGTHEKDDISRCVCHFFKILIFWIVKGLKGQKTVQNNKKFCPSRFIPQEPYIMIVIYGTHL